MVNRVKIKAPLLTGFATIDFLFPLGKGQRQLICGNRNTGKTRLVINIILGQKRANRYFNPELYWGD